MSHRVASIGVIGGSGFYKFLRTKKASRLETPYGSLSASVRLSEVEGKRIAFIPRHGEHHEFPPHTVPYRANIYAMKQLGVERIFGPTAVGSLKAGIRPGDFVISDQFVNYTNGRKDTYFEGPETAHVGAADPYCPEGVLYLINTNYLSLFLHERAAFSFTGFESTLPNNQLGYIGAILSLLELVDVKCKAHGKFDGLAFLNI